MTPEKKPKESIAPMLVGKESSIDPNDLNLIYNCDIISLNGDERLRDGILRDGETPVCLEGMEVFSPIKRKGTIEHLYSPIKVSKEKVEKESEKAEARRNISCNQVVVQEHEKRFVKIPNEAKQYGPKFSIEVFKHLCITEFRDSDRGGRCKKLEQTLSQSLGLSCRYCDGESGKKKGGRCGRYFPTSFKTFKDPNKILFSVYRHLKRCQQCPTEVMQRLDTFYSVYETERAAQKRGTQVKFYDLLWKAFRENEFEGL